MARLLYEERRPGANLLLVGGLIATAIVHGALIVAVVITKTLQKVEVQPPAFGHVVDVQAVKFGKPRDMSFLPHKEAPPAPRPKPKLALTDNEHALPHLKTPDEKDNRPVEDDPLKRTHAGAFKDLADPDNSALTT